MIPQVPGTCPWRVSDILPSGWVKLHEHGCEGRDVWLNLASVTALVPVWLIAVP